MVVSFTLVSLEKEKPTHACVYESRSYYDRIKRFQKICEADLRQTRRRTQAGLLPGKDDNDVWHKSDRKDLKGFYAMIVSGRTGSEAAG